MGDKQPAWGEQDRPPSLQGHRRRLGKRAWPRVLRHRNQRSGPTEGRGSSSRKQAQGATREGHLAEKQKPLSWGILECSCPKQRRGKPEVGPEPRAAREPVIRGHGVPPSAHLRKCALLRGQAQAGGFFELRMQRTRRTWARSSPPRAHLTPR